MKNSSSNLVISGERDIEIFRSATGILEIIRNEAFNKKGEGFTLEIQPKITKSRVYTQALFKKTWKYSATDSFISNWELEWKQGLSYQLNEVKTVLPPAIQIKLMLQEILVDERKNNPENWSDTAHYVLMGIGALVFVVGFYRNADGVHRKRSLQNVLWKMV